MQWIDECTGIPLGIHINSTETFSKWEYMVLGYKYVCVYIYVYIYR